MLLPPNYFLCEEIFHPPYSFSIGGYPSNFGCFIITLLIKIKLFINFKLPLIRFIRNFEIKSLRLMMMVVDWMLWRLDLKWILRNIILAIMLRETTSWLRLDHAWGIDSHLIKVWWTLNKMLRRAIFLYESLLFFISAWMKVLTIRSITWVRSWSSSYLSWLNWIVRITYILWGGMLVMSISRSILISALTSISPIVISTPSFMAIMMTSIMIIMMFVWPPTILTMAVISIWVHWTRTPSSIRTFMIFISTTTFFSFSPWLMLMISTWIIPWIQLSFFSYYRRSRVNLLVESIMPTFLRK